MISTSLTNVIFLLRAIHKGAQHFSLFAPMSLSSNRKKTIFIQHYVTCDICFYTNSFEYFSLILNVFLNCSQKFVESHRSHTFPKELSLFTSDNFVYMPSPNLTQEPPQVISCLNEEEKQKSYLRIIRNRNRKGLIFLKAIVTKKKTKYKHRHKKRTAVSEYKT